jgi:hypothetical protein
MRRLLRFVWGWVPLAALILGCWYWPWSDPKKPHEFFWSVLRRVPVWIAVMAYCYLLWRHKQVCQNRPTQIPDRQSPDPIRNG